MSEHDTLTQKAWTEDAEQKVLPTGTWDLRFMSALVRQPKREGNSPSLVVFFAPVKPSGDVSKSALKALGDYDWTQDELAMDITECLWLSERKNDRGKIFKHMSKYRFPDGEGVPAVPMFATNDDGNLMVAAAFKAAMQGALIEGELGLDEYNGETRNVAKAFAVPTV